MDPPLMGLRSALGIRTYWIRVPAHPLHLSAFASWLRRDNLDDLQHSWRLSVAEQVLKLRKHLAKSKVRARAIAQMVRANQDLQFQSLYPAPSSRIILHAALGQSSISYYEQANGAL